MLSVIPSNESFHASACFVLVMRTALRGRRRVLEIPKEGVNEGIIVTRAWKAE